MASPAYRAAKRATDLALAGLGLLLLAPLLLLLALAVRWRLGSPVLFRHTRPGFQGRPFEMIKFRTMTDARDGEGNLMPDMERLSPFGAFLRSASLDELPELVNVLRGDMSLVGPRPLMMEYLPHYNAYERLRHEVPPGITGWAQIHGRNAISWQEKFALDAWYVDHASLLLDLRILLRTLGKVLRRDQINTSSSETMQLFTGSGNHDYSRHQRQG